jgi:hypothetical protein
MATDKPRINITTQPEVAAILRKLARREKRSVSSLAHALILQALADQEDKYFSKLAEGNEKSAKKKTGHDEFWQAIL